jgi:hypothetical protein
MLRTLRNSILAAAVVLGAAGCVVHETVAVRPPPCPGAAWVEGHYGPYGHWHPGHWLCPGVAVASPAPPAAVTAQ